MEGSESIGLQDDGEDEFDPLLEDEEEDEELERKKRGIRGRLGGHELLYIGSLKVNMNQELVQTYSCR